MHYAQSVFENYHSIGLKTITSLEKKWAQHEKKKNTEIRKKKTQHTSNYRERIPFALYVSAKNLLSRLEKRCIAAASFLMEFIFFSSFARTTTIRLRFLLLYNFEHEPELVYAC